MNSLSHQLTAQQLRDIGSGSRLIIVHPAYVQQHLIFAELLHEDGFVYVRLDGMGLTRAEVEQQVVEALEQQTGAAHLHGIRYLVIDECDRADPAGIDALFADLLTQLDNGSLILLAREIPRSLLENDALREQVTYLPSDRSLMLWDYSQLEVSQATLLEVRALGTGRVLLNGQPVDNWDGVLPRSLFFYLVDRGMTTRNDIFETFWPNLSVREATNVFHVTKRKISEVLGVDLTIYWSGFYRISPEIELSYDVVQFSELLQGSVVQAADQATATLRQAIWLYRDNFLTSLDMEWVKDRRSELRQSYGEALIGLAKAVDADGALGYYLRALNINPQREDVAHSAMLLYQDMGLQEDALRVYTRLKDELEQIWVFPRRGIFRNWRRKSSGAEHRPQVCSRVLLVEPYFGGSHRAWAEGYRSYSSHQVDLLTLPAQFWKWRMQGGAVTLARMFDEQGLSPDVVLATDMFDLSTFRALTQLDVPCALYFHENQLTYPQNSRQRHGWQYGFINYASALAADAIFFNSVYHRDSFLDELPRMLKHFSDFNELDTVETIRERSAVLPLGLDLRRLDTYRPDNVSSGQPPLILWNHRWEEDKNPQLFLDTLYRLDAEGIPFRVALVGESFRQQPAEFEQARERLGDRVVAYGYLDHFADYARLLWEADYVVSTAYHDFFGIAVAEAIFCESVPLLPFRLNYPALLPERWHANCLYRVDDLYGLFVRHLRGEVTASTSDLRAAMTQYDWSQMVGRYDEALTRLALGLRPVIQS